MTAQNPQTQAEALADFRQKFRLAPLHLADCGTWALSLRPQQLTLGSMVLSLRSGGFNLADLGPVEGQDMAAGFALAEQLARGIFGAVRINLLCLMMQDPIVHFHIIPRYDQPVLRHGLTWQDQDWPVAPTLRPVETSAPALDAVLSDLRAAIARLPESSA